MKSKAQTADQKFKRALREINHSVISTLQRGGFHRGPIIEEKRIFYHYDWPSRTQIGVNLQLLIDSTPALIHSVLPDGFLDFFNQRWLNYVGLSLESLSGWNWTATIDPEACIREWIVGEGGFCGD
jgi:PAS domain-containing protein